MATSKLSQFLEDVDEKVLECAICFTRLQNPKSLNCLHSFCLSCLEDWVKEKGTLTCPTCSKSYPIPEGGLQKLPPNTFLNDILETFHQYFTTENQIMKCICGKTEENYCQDCRHYLCSSCSDYHKLLPMSANHKLHTVEDVLSMTPQDFALLNPPLCSLHSKPLELYCQDCKTPICMHCTFINHKVWEGKHKPISISDAFQTFKKTSATLEEVAHHYENKLQDGLKAVIQTSVKLEENRVTSLQDIGSLVQEMIKTITNKGDEMKNNVEIIYIQKRQEIDVQIDELKKIISEVNTKLSFLKQLLNSDEATAMQSSETVIKALEDRLNEMPKTEPTDNGQILFFANKHHITFLQQYDIGNVTQTMTDGLTLKGAESVTQGQVIVAKIIKTDRCNIDANQLKATWTHPTGETNTTEVDEDDNRDYVVTGKCVSPGVCRLDVSVDGEPIKQSPMIIKVEQEGLVNTIKLDKDMEYYDFVKCEDGSLLVSCMTNTMYKYKQSGEYIDKITLTKGVEIFAMYTMKNGNIAVSDDANKCIKIVKMNGEVIKSIGQGILGDPAAIHMDEASNVLYVADYTNECLFMFDIDSSQMIRKIMLPGNINGDINISLTNQEHILALVGNPKKSCKNRLYQYDSEGRLIRLLIKGDEHDILDFQGVVVDEDDNIIVLSDQKLQLFSSDGNFIKRIDKPENGITDPGGVCLISQHPRRVAVANDGDKTIKIYNY
ncbi:tripartite motif-containing protein 2-like [Anneissia japonica]|uniref:tripartite motif-containing protein 2-like n=1 Tax=Anneissia japonica TaxID=1529436 RepID=UPI001425B536|nr:tripartite motif-containing protein 2-like [Anneissia japonica]XP_033100188.1 tripartite motif-containing protein 2-like [Anneissia japonica]XP_033100189.1 tripartite motif-containing protein 2-like [Anneissia japonica]XP_033100190.1 tripartite motif-containing protein 2-like [Anneissia japonica]